MESCASNIWSLLGHGSRFGCGVGWGPGFGPDVIGYVGAGCGIGFSVGITFAGFGIGLPANFLIKAPYKAVVATRSLAPGFIRSSNPVPVQNNVGDEWTNNLLPQLQSFQQNANERLPFLRDLDGLRKGMVTFDLKTSVSSCSKSVAENFKSFRRQLSNPGEDSGGCSS